MELFFFPFLLPSFCHSVVYRVVSIVSDGRNQSSFVFFYVVFESLYGCINVVFDAGKSSSPPLFLVRIVCPHRLWDVMPCACEYIYIYIYIYICVCVCVCLNTYIYIYLNYPVSVQGQCVWIIVLHRIYEGNHINL